MDAQRHLDCVQERHDLSGPVEKAFEEIFRIAIDLGGTITGEHGVGLAKKSFLKEWIDPGVFRMMETLKTMFDPNNILNPGKIFDLSPKCEGRFPVKQI